MFFFFYHGTTVVKTLEWKLLCLGTETNSKKFLNCYVLRKVWLCKRYQGYLGMEVINGVI